MTEEKTIQEKKESVKLSINAKGNFQWEIKVLGSGPDGEFFPEDKGRLDKINKELQQTYGSEKEGK